MAKKLENMTPDERYEHYSKMRVKEQRERKKIADQIPVELSVQVKELVALANEVACDGLYNGGPRYIPCDLFHQLEDQANKVKNLYCFGS